MMKPSARLISACVMLPSGPGMRSCSVNPKALDKKSSAAAQSSYKRYGVMRGNPSGGFATMVALPSRVEREMYAWSHRSRTGAGGVDQPVRQADADDGADELERIDGLGAHHRAHEERADRKKPCEQAGALDAEPADALVPRDEGECGHDDGEKRDGADLTPRRPLER